MARYYTKFEDSDIAALPTGFSRRGTASSAPANHVVTVEYGLPRVKRRQCRYAQVAGSSLGFISLDAVDADADRDECEVVVPAKRDPAAGSMNIMVYARGSGAAGSLNAYYAQVSFPDAGSPGLFLIKSVAGAVTVLATDAAFVADEDKEYLIRFRVEGSDLKLRVWAEDEAEPTAWSVTASDGDVTAAGWIGFQAHSANASAVFNFLSVATNGDTAWTPRTNAEYSAWLAQQGAARRVIFEIAATGYDSVSSPVSTGDVPVYIANGGYTSKPWDDPPNQFYRGIVVGKPTITRQLASDSFVGGAKLGFGSLKVTNPRGNDGQGERDEWLRMKWKRNYVKAWLGDPSWAKHDFRMQLFGRLGQPIEPSESQIEFPIADLLDILSGPIQEDRFSSSQPLQNQCLPVLAGAVMWVEPVPTSTSTLEQQLNDGPIQSIGDVYDNGIALSGTGSVASADPATDLLSDTAHGLSAGSQVRFFAGSPPAPLVGGTTYFVIADGLGADVFKLSATLGGAAINITATGSAGYTYKLWSENLSNGKFTPVSNPAGRLMCRLVTEQSTAGDLCKLPEVLDRLLFDRYGLSRNFKDDAAFDGCLTDLPNNVGLMLYGEKVSALEVLERLCRGTNAWYGMTPDGLLQIGRLKLPSSTAVLNLAERDVKNVRLVRTILPVNRATLVVRTSRRFYLNGPLSLPPTATKELLQNYWAIIGSAWPAAGTPLDESPNLADVAEFPEFDSLFTSNAESPDEIDRLEDLYEKKIGIFSLQTRLSASQLSIGDTIQLEHSRGGWKTYSAGDPASPDNTGDFDATKAVVIGIASNLGADDSLPVRLTVYRQIPGYYPEV